MCQPKPGPRCTGHVRTQLKKLQDFVDTAQAQVDAYGGPPRSDSDRYSKSSQEALARTLERRLAKGQQALAQMTSLWHETPGGMKELNDQYQAAVASGDTTGARALKVEFQRGKAARAHSKFLLASQKAQNEISESIRTALESLPDNDGSVQHVVAGSPGSYRNVVTANSFDTAVKVKGHLSAHGLEDVRVERVGVAYGPESMTEFDVWSEPDMLIREDLDAKEWGM